MDESYFSISWTLLKFLNVVSIEDQGEKVLRLPCSLYINSSSIQDRRRFMIFYSANEVIDKKIIQRAKECQWIYLRERDKELFFQSLSLSPTFQNIDIKTLEKTQALKDVISQDLKDLFLSVNDMQTSKNLLKKSMQGLSQIYETLKDMDFESIVSMVSQLAEFDYYTFDHSLNVAIYSLLFYQQQIPINKRQEKYREILSVGLGALLHDLGKSKIPLCIINKPEQLSPEEFSVIKQHPEWGEHLLANFKETILALGLNESIISQIIGEHHENFNGSGYPHHKHGHSISLPGRVVAICDFFDAITTPRSYHKAMSFTDALIFMKASLNKKIDAKLFYSFEALLPQFKLMVSSKEKSYEKKFKKIISDLGHESITFDPCQPSSNGKKSN